MKLSNRTRIIIIILALLVMIAGILCAAYPYIASIYAEQVRSEVQTHYEEVLNTSNEEMLATLRAEAEEWNKQLFTGQISPLEPDTNGYYDTLQLPNTSVIGTIRIPSIDINLPIYHSIADNILAKGVGHMPQSSLPVGGINTHSVLSAHSGMSNSPMFSNLELMEVGDIFYIDILGETLTYQVYEIQEYVDPADITTVQIQRDRDLCTLITCMPYGINSHRLLVHGERIQTVEEPEETTPTATTSPDKTASSKSVWNAQYLLSIIYGAVLACVMVFVAIIVHKTLRRRKDAEQAGEEAES